MVPLGDSDYIYQMTNETIILTDPARELAELCASLQTQTNVKGDAFLAKHFSVKPWSREFFQIIFTIVERCSLVQDIVQDLDFDDDFREDVISHIDSIRDAFSADAMRNQWVNYGFDRVGPINVGPVKAISSAVRQKVAYRKLSDDEIADLERQVGDLIAWLKDRQLMEVDFVRQALIDGLQNFQFRLSRLQWLGWGYALDSLREVIAAYMLLERGGIDPKANPEGAAILQKVGAVIKVVYAKVSATKNVVETGDWLLRAYGAGSLIYQAGSSGISGLIGQQ